MTAADDALFDPDPPETQPGAVSVHVDEAGSIVVHQIGGVQVDEFGTETPFCSARIVVGGWGEALALAGQLLAALAHNGPSRACTRTERR